MTKQYIVAVKIRGTGTEIYAFPTEQQRSGFIKQIKKLSKTAEFATSEV